MALYIVSVPIGHPDDITLRAINTLKDVDFLICEEFKPARRLLKRLEIQKELFSLNEHNEKRDTEEIIQQLLQGIYPVRRQSYHSFLLHVVQNNLL